MMVVSCRAVYTSHLRLGCQLPTQAMTFRMTSIVILDSLIDSRIGARIGAPNKPRMMLTCAQAPVDGGTEVAELP